MKTVIRHCSIYITLFLYGAFVQNTKALSTRFFFFFLPVWAQTAENNVFQPTWNGRSRQTSVGTIQNTSCVYSYTPRTDTNAEIQSSNPDVTFSVPMTSAAGHTTTVRPAMLPGDFGFTPGNALAVSHTRIAYNLAVSKQSKTCLKALHRGLRRTRGGKTGHLPTVGFQKPNTSHQRCSIVLNRSPLQPLHKQF